MTSKEYLMQIYNLDHKIYMMQLEADEFQKECIYPYQQRNVGIVKP